MQNFSSKGGCLRRWTCHTKRIIKNFQLEGFLGGPLKRPHGLRGREILHCFHFDAKSNCLSFIFFLSLVIYEYSFTIVCLLSGRWVNALLVGWLVGWSLFGIFQAVLLCLPCDLRVHVKNSDM